MNQELLAALERAIAREPESTVLRIHLAHLLLQAGQHAAALGHCQVALASDPHNDAAIGIAAAAQQALTASTHGGAQTTSREPSGPLPASDAVPPEALVDADGLGELYELVRPEITLDDVAGLADVKERLQVSFLEPLRNPELREMYGASLRSGLLLYGPPGCGKTLIAKALAGELGLYFVAGHLNELLDMYLGQSEKNVHDLFELARSSAPSVLFLDEIDAIGHKRTRLRGDSGLRSVVNQLLTELDGVEHSNDGVLILGATNQPWDIDPALRRPGRFDRQLLVLPPDAAARRSILEHSFVDRPIGDLDLDLIVSRTDGYSGADVEHLAASAAELALSDSIRSGTARPINDADLAAAVAQVSRSTDAWFEDVRPFVQFSNEDGQYDELAKHLKRRRRK